MPEQNKSETKWELKKKSSARMGVRTMCRL